ncbi:MULTISPECIES: photosynthetic complex assembly protein PuhC [unclassified Sphingomonas]|jgi:putative photosynthetic complex assembly protein|uniref:photosynthetic complex assembly protein PuhC n=1 Tax=unclassified Sphingomonas TaxID=196159 RepID=UPI000835B2C5|nr:MULTISPECIES: photosynthetic complex assembly protein PuhC [unclassified Sphingomonas]MCH4891967.1 phosphonoacetaldehyde methylase [Sphingomonas sp. SFZ2018-12]
MTTHSHENTVPQGALILAGALVAFTLVATVTVRMIGLPPAASPVAERAAAHVPMVTSQTLRFADREDGGVAITRADGRVTLLPRGSNSGFIRGVMRGFARDRRMRGLGPDTPFVLAAWANGGLSLTDTATGRSVELNGFGIDNRAAFMALLAPEAK